jgi:3-deoxy-D-manno-octulosonate 8-phosphate phosphatase (KDO 8-P phosphatase)
VKRRAEKLKIAHCHTGIADKLTVLQGICQELHISLSDVAYVGDDINDIPVLREAGFSACPSSAPIYIQQMATKVLTKKGGEGVFREFVEGIFSAAGVFEELLSKHYGAGH